MIVPVVCCALFLAAGLLGTFWPRAVQTFELDCYGELSPFPLVSLLRKYVGSDVYISQLRIIGGFCLLAAGGLLYAVIQWQH